MRASPLLRIVVALACLATTRGGAPVTALAYHPGGEWLAVGRPGAIQRINREGPGHPERIPVPLPRVAALAFSPDGHLLLASGGRPGIEGAVVAVSLSGARPPGVLARSGDLVASVAVSPDGRLGAWGDGQEVCLLALGDGSASPPPRRLVGHSGPVRSVAFSPDGRLVVSAGMDRSVRVWSVESGRELRSFGQHTDAVHAVVFSPGAGRLECATAGDDRTIRIWQPDIGRMVRIVRHHSGPVLALAYLPGGERLLSVGTEGVVRWIDADSDRIRASVTMGPEVVYGLAVSPDGREVAVGDWSGVVSRREAGSGGELARIGPDPAP